jgi:NAD(P)-dependent dehydrogenase (short-subunit alcohol dehydrogenase family)
MDNLSGNVAVVTGAASGIGLAVATAFAHEGMKVVVADIEQGALEAAAAGLSGAGHDVLAVRTDVSDPAAVQHLADATMAHFGAVHVLHNNAGVVASGPIEELALSTWEWVLGVDLWSVIYGIRSFLPLIKAQGEGHVISTASTAGLQANAGIGPYNAAKFAVVGLMETLKLELERDGSLIGASVLCPGAVNTQIVFSDRNRPAGVTAEHRGSATEDAFKANAGTMLASQGKDPAEVAAMVVDAIRTDRFWIVTHDAWFDILRSRVEAMAENGRLAVGFGG